MRERVNDSPLVIKFGGTSVGGGAAFKRAAYIAADAARGRPVAVVVSAMSGVTNLLLGHASGIVDSDGSAAEEQRSTGVTDDYVRLSVGLESIDDILYDLDQALNGS